MTPKPITTNFKAFTPGVSGMAGGVVVGLLIWRGVSCGGWLR